ncbi:GTA baseplate fiber-binding domain-containing protein [Thalassovita mediterranea]|uniref:GTA baseplate fiber-binding domain-containing protein n=1 Tax=Thalassovita mediterranea TaxID=340021 RepID=UPI003F9641D3
MELVSLGLLSGHLESRTPDEVLAGANVIAIGNGTPDGWEVAQFTSADLVALGDYGPRYHLRGLLRGQQGSEVEMADLWPVGSYVVLLDGTAQQLGLAANTRGLAQHFRIGPARRGYDDPSFVHEVHAFAGRGLRPYAPVHLRAAAANGDLMIRWIRRTRIDGDSWDGLDVPLGEEREQYLLRVLDGSTVVREVVIDQTEWAYTAAEQALNGGVTDRVVEVRQISASYGAGAAARLTLG